MDKTIKERLSLIDSSEIIEERYSVFNSIAGGKIPIIRINIEAAAFVVRQRINGKNKDFSNVMDLSYPRDCSKSCIRER